MSRVDTAQRVRYKWAIDSNGKHFYVLGKKRQDTEGLTFRCPWCDGIMVPAMGERNIEHFRHKGMPCDNDNRLHKTAEMVFLEEYRKCLDQSLPFYLEMPVPVPCNHGCILKEHNDCNEHYILRETDLTKRFRTISLEPRVVVDDEVRFPDILLESATGEQLWIEIFVTNSDETKHSIASVIEIKIENDDDIATFLTHKISVSDKIKAYNVNLFPTLYTSINPPCDKQYVFESVNGKNGLGRIESVEKIEPCISSSQHYRCILHLNRGLGYRNPVPPDFESTFQRISLRELDWLMSLRMLSGTDNFFLRTDGPCMDCTHLERITGQIDRALKMQMRQCDICKSGMTSQGDPGGPAVWCTSRGILTKKAPRDCFSFRERAFVPNNEFVHHHCNLLQQDRALWDHGCDSFEPKRADKGVTIPGFVLPDVPAEQKKDVLISIWKCLSTLIRKEETRTR